MVESADQPASESPPQWAYEFHGHVCPLMPLGYRMGRLAMKELGVDRASGSESLVFPEVGVGPLETCLTDGIQVATGCTSGKMLMDRRPYGKAAMVLYHPARGAVRVALRPDFSDALETFAFFAYLRNGVDPSGVPDDVVEAASEWALSQPDSAVFTVERLPGFRCQRPAISVYRTRCTACGEYVFERYLRTVNGEPHCIPCSGYGE